MGSRASGIFGGLSLDLGLCCAGFGRKFKASARSPEFACLGLYPSSFLKGCKICKVASETLNSCTWKPEAKVSVLLCRLGLRDVGCLSADENRG